MEDIPVAPPPKSPHFECLRCVYELPRSDFYDVKTRKDGRDPICKHCRNEERAERRRKSSETAADLRRRRAQDSRRRWAALAREQAKREAKPHPMSDEEIDRMMVRGRDGLWHKRRKVNEPLTSDPRKAAELLLVALLGQDGKATWGWLRRHRHTGDALNWAMRLGAVLKVDHCTYVLSDIGRRFATDGRIPARIFSALMNSHLAIPV